MPPDLIDADNLDSLHDDDNADDRINDEDNVDSLIEADNVDLLNDADVDLVSGLASERSVLHIIMLLLCGTAD